MPVMIRQLEKSVIENAFENGYIKQIVPESKSSKSVAVVGAGPSGLYMAFELYKDIMLQFMKKEKMQAGF